MSGESYTARFAVALGSAIRKFPFNAWGGQSLAQAAACKYHDKLSSLLARFELTRGKDTNQIVIMQKCLRVQIDSLWPCSSTGHYIDIYIYNDISER